MNQIIDLNNFTFDAVLLYDSEGPTEKYVDYVKVKPVDHKATVNDIGDQVTIELRIKVLTSQHENSFFRVKIFLLDPTTGMPFHPSLIVLSEPVKVISKPEQVKKKSSPSNLVSVPTYFSAANASISVSAPTSKKRNVNDLLLETISRIEETQRDHQQMIEKLLRGSETKQQQSSNHHQQQQSFSDISSSNDVSALSSSENLIPCGLNGKMNGSDEFENSFRSFFKVYNNLAADEKPIKIRKLIRNSSQRDTEKISEFLDLFLTEGLQRIPPIDVLVQKNTPCQCTSCPYQKELQNIDKFYEDFLSLPLNANQDPL
jgi:hypothetical protein